MFPKRVPPITIQTGPEAFDVSNCDCAYMFVPLHHGAEAEIVSYTYPSEECSEISSVRVQALFSHNDRHYFRIIEQAEVTGDADLARGGTCDFYLSLRGDEVFTDAIIEDAYQQDMEYTQYQDGPERISVHPGQTWKGRSLVRHHPGDEWELDIEKEIRVDETGYRVQIGEAQFTCIRLMEKAVPYRGTPPVRLAPELVNESYIDSNGRCVLVRRFNGPVWSEWNEQLWQKIEGSPRLEVDGTEYRLWYVKLPGWVLAKA